jgi:hypothetical protein
MIGRPATRREMVPYGLEKVAYPLFVFPFSVLFLVAIQ